MSSTNDCGASNLPVVSWAADIGGRCPGSIQSSSDNGKYTLPLAQGSQLAINGNVDLSRTIVGPSGAFVQKITYEHFTGIDRSSVIYVHGQGPEGTLSGSLALTFLTEAGETHTLSLTSSSLGCHSGARARRQLSPLFHDLHPAGAGIQLRRVEAQDLSPRPQLGDTAAC